MTSYRQTGILKVCRRFIRESVVIGRTLILKLADSPRVQRFVRNNRATTSIVRRFVAGDTIEEAMPALLALNQRGMTIALDYLGENVTRAEEAAEFVAYYRRLLGIMDASRLDGYVSLKLTQLGMDISEELVYANMVSILEEADRYQRFIRIDMEGSAYTAKTLDIFCRLRSNFSNVGIVIQSYLHRSARDVEMLIESGAPVRLVKGAYKEPKEIAFQRKRDVDRNFIALMQMLLTRGNDPAIATHDAAIIRAAKQFAREKGIDPSRFEFQMLYGIRRDLQDRLAHEGYRMRVYTPFGTQWYGYLMRRLAERPANLWFVMKNLLRR